MSILSSFLPSSFNPQVPLTPTRKPSNFQVRFHCRALSLYRLLSAVCRRVCRAASSLLSLQRIPASSHRVLAILLLSSSSVLHYVPSILCRSSHVDDDQSVSGSKLNSPGSPSHRLNDPRHCRPDSPLPSPPDFHLQLETVS